MNRPGIIWIAITLMPSTLSLTYAQSDNGFEELYRKADEKVRAYLYKDQYGEVEPVWKDTHTFCYQTSGSFSITSGTVMSRYGLISAKAPIRIAGVGVLPM